ncbi:MAG: DNA polymerase/3'-5' exonuclease PolX [Nitrospirota bacterium]|jgi:DNA polymerase (family 10)|nr:DNA polymerase/3'-5' exonuclease PolX [Nitrospirota bacterium]MDH5296398.1 DNA polymerase/3'-5' exonuclease PolX [Nitrospirota bacterium]
MPVHNTDIAEKFSRLAELLEIQGANPFRIRAYRKAAQTIESLPHSVASMLAEGADLSELPGIGEDLAAKIQEIVQTGHLSLLDQVSSQLPGQLAELAKIPSLGPKRVKLLYDTLGIQDLKGLAKAAQAGTIRQLHGFGPKIEEKILAETNRRSGSEQRIKISTAEEFAEPILDYLRSAKGVKDPIIAGSYRRRKDTIGDLDILVTCTQAKPVMDRFVAYDEVETVVSKGHTRATVVLRSGLQVDLRVVPEDSYGAALQYFTGSKAHNIAVRSLAVKKGLKINEYGVFRGETRIAGRTEEEVYAQVGLPYIVPELRENWGEVEAGLRHALPDLITLNAIRGDLHVHSKASDGHFSIKDMALAAQEKGYEYLAICDHSQRVTIAHGLNAKRLAAQLEEIDRLNDTFKGFTLLKGAEVDILEDGSLDLSDDLLSRLDLTVCAIHYKFNLPRAKQTERIIRAMDHPAFSILAHPTGRMLNEREPYEIDMEQVMAAALERGCYLEINAQPVRLDLTDLHCKMAKDMGVKAAISTDAHRTTDLDFMRFGVGQARRGWLEPTEILNTRRLKELKKLFRRT